MYGEPKEEVQLRIDEILSEIDAANDGDTSWADAWESKDDFIIAKTQEMQALKEQSLIVRQTTGEDGLINVPLGHLHEIAKTEKTTYSNGGLRRYDEVYLNIIEERAPDGYEIEDGKDAWRVRMGVASILRNGAWLIESVRVIDAAFASDQVNKISVDYDSTSGMPILLIPNGDMSTSLPNSGSNGHQVSFLGVIGVFILTLCLRRIAYWGGGSNDRA